jgi:hypothetical protein
MASNDLDAYSIEDLRRKAKKRLEEITSRAVAS